MARAEALHQGLGIDVTDFAAFAKALRKQAPEIRKHLTTNLRMVGEIVAAEARMKAGGASSSIPSSIKVRISNASVSVVAGGAGVPLAGLMELGNRGAGASSSFRHPVFGGATWVSQPTHPYLVPALTAKFAEAEKAAVEALDAAIAEVMISG